MTKGEIEVKSKEEEVKDSDEKKTYSTKKMKMAIQRIETQM